MDELQDTSRIATKDLCRILGISDDTVRSLARQGIFKATGRGKYDLCQTVQAYLRYIENDRAADTIADIRHGLTAERTRKLRLENDQREAECLPAGEVHAFAGEAQQTLKTRLLALVDRAADELAKTTSPAVARQILSNHIHGVLTNASTDFRAIAEPGNAQ